MGIHQMLFSKGVPLTASAFPTTATGLPPVTTPGTSNSTPSTATATGGSGSYTYNWQYVSGSTAITLVNPSSSATMIWQFLYTSPSSTASAIYRCEVSDGSTSVFTNNVTVSFIT